MAEKFNFKQTLTDTNPPTVAGSGDKLLRNCGIGCVGIIALFVIIFAVSASVGGDSDEPNSYEAIRYCEDKVETMLKAPASAEFSSTSTAANPFTVTGTVDSENSFGAILRANFQCTVTISGDSFTASVDYLE